MQAECNICGSNEFTAYRGRPNEVCAQCGAKARHRVGIEIYERLLPAYATEQGRVLHLAPERFLHAWLQEMFGAGYMTADAEPERYPHASALRLRLPDGFQVFPQGYFDVILHNHVLEHIPGSYKEHLGSFVRVLAPGGVMIFSVPGPYMDRETREGGEFFKTDAERLEAFLQEDHFKLLGADFVEYLEAMPGGSLLDDGVTDARRAQIAVRPGKARFFVWRKDG